MYPYRDFVRAFQELGLGSGRRVIAHVGLGGTQEVAGLAEVVLGALLRTCEGLMMPAFTSRAMVTPPYGPAHNAMRYGDAPNQIPDRESFHPDMPVDPDLGEVAERLRKLPETRRSHHPLLSFCGVNVEKGLEAQSLEDPWFPIQWLAELDGDVLLVGGSHTQNVSLHYAEHQAGRKQFIRWAITKGKIVECPHWPGCSEGFQAIGPRLRGVTRVEKVGDLRIQLIPLRDLIHIATGWIREDDQALLCDREDCRYCQDVRHSLAGEKSS